MESSIPSLFLGTYQNSSNLSKVIETAFEEGVYGFDTAPSYGTEGILGRCIRNNLSKYQIERNKIWVSDKIDSWQMHATKGEVEKYVKQALNLMQLDYFDILYVHWPQPEYLIKTWETFIRIKERGLVKYIGLCNVHKRHVDTVLSQTGINPDYIQIERHPLNTCLPEIDYYTQAGIRVQAYSAIGRMDKRLTGSRGLQELGRKYNKSIPQIILRWHLDTKVIPVFMSNKAERIRENANIYDFSLQQCEIEDINSLNINYKLFVESLSNPGI